MIKNLIFSTMVLFTIHTFGQLTYSRVKIHLNGKDLQELAQLGLAVDHGQYKKNTFFIGDLSNEEIAVLDAYGYSYDIIHADVKEYYRSINKLDNQNKNTSCVGGSGSTSPSYPVPVNFDMNSSYAGFYKYNDMLAELDQMAAQYPNLITVKTPISTFLTHEGRPIYQVKISDNPNTQEAEPEILYTAIHHAREPLSMSQTIYYMWFLLENYATNDEVKYIVDNFQMYFVPCINPDGYIHNETNDPTGFGMHRKNKRNVGTTNPGVDLNRNYSYGWGTTGVSFNTNNDTYPGTGPFTEPETQAMKWMQENHTFISAFNAHTYGNMILFPVGTTSAEFADHHDYFTDLCGHMTTYNGYVAQKSSGLYPASGDSDDYAYKVDIGVGMKDSVFSFTPEIGSDFWPPQSEILSTCNDMVFPNLVLAHMAKKYLIVADSDPSSINTLTGNFNHTALRLGLEAGAVSVGIQPLLNIQSVGAPVVYNLSLRQSSSGSISYTLDPGVQFGDEVKYVLETDYGLWIRRDTITKIFGSVTPQVVEDGSNANWTGNWGITSSTSYSPSTSYADSPTGDYANNTTRTYTYTPVIDLTNAVAAQVSFYAKWDIEADYDYVQFQVSTDNGATWEGQCGNYTVAGNGTIGGVQPGGEPVYEGVQSNWVLEEINLSDYLGQQVKFRFILQSDGGVRGDGYFFDDFTIGYDINTSSASLSELTDAKLIVSPNPANEDLKVAGMDANTELTIIDLNGQVITRHFSPSTVTTINIEQVAAGTYIIQGTKNGVLTRSKFVKR